MEKNLKVGGIDRGCGGKKRAERGVKKQHLIPLLFLSHDKVIEREAKQRTKKANEVVSNALLSNK